MSTDFEMGCLATFTSGAGYLVQCNLCLKDIGTMTADGIKRAIFRCLGRGGILCPECRQHTCDVCTVYSSDKTVLRGLLTVSGDFVRTCPGCLRALGEMGDELLPVAIASAVMEARLNPEKLLVFSST